MKLGFGLMRLPVIDGEQTNIDVEAFKAMADAFLAAGGTYFDTAYPYHGGKSEVAFKEAVVKRYPRDAYTVTDKMPMFKLEKEEDLPVIFAEQLERTGVDHFDYYWLHALNRNSYEKAKNLHAFEFISRMKEEGKTVHIGFSFHDTADVLDMILTEHPEVEYVQLQLNYIDWESESVQGRKCYEVCEKHGKPVVVMEPIKGGALAKVSADAEKLMKEAEPDLSVASWAVRWIADKENVFKVLSGMSDQEQMDDNLSYMKDFTSMTEAEKDVVGKATEIIKSSIAVPCTGCRYCISEQSCPMDIRIPDIFKLYNDFSNFSIDRWDVKDGLEKLTAESGRPSDCVGCAGCEAHCPQHLPIRDYLAQFAEKFDKK